MELFCIKQLEINVLQSTKEKQRTNKRKINKIDHFLSNTANWAAAHTKLLDESNGREKKMQNNNLQFYKYLEECYLFCATHSDVFVRVRGRMCVCCDDDLTWIFCVLFFFFLSFHWYWLLWFNNIEFSSSHYWLTHSHSLTRIQPYGISIINTFAYGNIPSQGCSVSVIFVEKNRFICLKLAISNIIFPK